MSKAVNTYLNYNWAGVNRFEISFNGTLSANQTSQTSATFRLQGTWTLKINTLATNYHVIYKASDYMAFVKGDQDFAATGSASTSGAYKKSLPYGINAGTGNIISETRVDSYRYNASEIGGTIWNQSGSGVSWQHNVGTYTCSVDQSFTLTLNGSRDQIVLRYFASGSDRNNISWITASAWNTLAIVGDYIDEGTIAFDYRPGERKVNGTWSSHNRGSGWAERKNGSWYELRTKEGGTGSGDPPERKISGSWKNQSKLGAE